MRKFLFTILALVAFSAIAQAGEYVKWNSSVKDNGEPLHKLR